MSALIIMHQLHLSLQCYRWGVKYDFVENTAPFYRWVYSELTSS
jgi:hypothetical protein